MDPTSRSGPRTDPSVDGRPSAIREVVVVAGGDPTGTQLATAPPDDAIVIAADGGLALARLLGLEVDVVAGDMDSVDPDDLARARAAGARIDRHPADKDRTDLAIALDLALTHAPARVTVLGGHGGRLDHHLANLLLLAAPAYAPLDIVAHMGSATVTIVRSEAGLVGEPGETISLLALHGPARGVTTDGLRFALTDDVLEAGSSRGVSNEFLSGRASVRLRTGVVAAIQPGHIDPIRGES